METTILGTESIVAELSRALDLVELRHSVLASNIANASTGGYQRMEVVANDTVSPIAAELEEGGVELPVGEVVPSANATVRLDQEMAQMSQNAVRFQQLIGAFERTTGLLRMAIHEGRGG
jgi:flagellar basal body rod protein FlgB